MPLCTATMFPSSLLCGCALFSDGSPCVAHLVCPIPHEPITALPSFVFSARILSLPFAFTISTGFSPSRTAIPAESYPRYSNLDSPSNKIGAACSLPVNPTIPHIIIYSLFRLACLFFFNYRYNIINIFFTYLLSFSFYHYTNQRLCT